MTNKQISDYKRIVDPKNKVSREMFFSDLMEVCRKYNQLEGWEKFNVLGIVRHKIKEQEE